ncbi:MAG: IS110 family transposase [bacterium]|nr:IS110 family transposase [bacterium]
MNMTTTVTAGVDTHRDVHMAAALDHRGAELGVRAFDTNDAGYHELLAWLETFGPVERIGVEGTGTYGVGLTRFLHRNNIVVVEVTRPDRQERRSHGKSDEVDAIAAARSAQSGRATAQPKTRDGSVEAIRTLRIIRRSATRDRTSAINQMRALIVTAPDEIREQYRGTTINKWTGVVVPDSRFVVPLIG